MGKVLVTAKIENLHDVLDVRTGRLAAEKVRSVEVADALVDTGASMLSMPKRLIAQLGLFPIRTRKARTSAGPAAVQVYDIGGRSFVIGKAAKTSQCTKESFAGKVIWIPFEKVKEMIGLPSE